MKTQPNDPINPLSRTNLTEKREKDHCSGLTKREYFAAMAMQGILDNEGTISEGNVAKWSVQYADALIKELNK